VSDPGAGNLIQGSLKEIVMRRNTFLIFSFVILSTILLQSCGSNSASSNLASAFACSVTGSVSGTSIINPTVSILNGAGGPYTYTYNGAALGSTSSTSFTIPETVVTGGVVTVTDASDSAVATCSVNSTTGITGTGTGVTVLVNGQAVTSGQAVSEAVGSTVTLSATSISGSTTFSFTGSSGNGITVSQTASNSAMVYDSSAISGSITVSVLDSTNSAYSASITICFGTTTCVGTTTGYYGTGAMSCTLSHTPGTYVTGYDSIFYLVASNGTELEVMQWYPGVAWTTQPGVFVPPYGYTPGGQLAQELQIIYNTPGQMNITVTAQSVSQPGLTCTASDSVYVQ
jgi:hypothetical protein